MTERNETEDVNFDTVNKLIKSFFERTTLEQRTMLTSGSPDNATIIQVAEMVLDLISMVSTSMLMIIRLKNEPDSEEKGLAALEESLYQIFCDVLGISQDDINENLKCLTEMIHKEIQSNLEYTLSSPGMSDIPPRTISPTRLNFMVCYVVELFKKCSANLKTCVAPCQAKKRRIVGKHSKDGLKSKTSETQDKISSELSDLIIPLMDDIPNSEFNELQPQISMAIQSVAHEIVDILSEDENKKQSIPTVREKIKSFFGNSFIIVWLFRILTQLKENYPQCCEAVSSQSVESIIDGLRSDLLDDDEDDEDENCLIRKFNSTSGDNMLVLVQALSHQISSHALQENDSDSASGTEPGLSESCAEMHAEIERKSWIYVVITNWFLNTKLKMLSYWLTPSVSHASPDFSNGESALDSEVKPDVSANLASECQEEQQEATLYKSCVSFFIEKVVAQICNNARTMPMEKNDIITDMEEVIWNEIKNEEFYFTDKAFKKLDKEIQKGLDRMRSSPDELLFLLCNRDVEIKDCIVRIVTKLLLTPPKTVNPIRRFFTSLGKVLSASMCLCIPRRDI